ncbi:MAG: primosomal protein N' [Pseudomonadota bacterium]
MPSPSPDPVSSVPVLLPLPVERAYTYGVPQGMELRPGDYVKVPLGPRLVAGIVWDGPVEDVPPEKLRQIEERFDCPPMSADTRKFVNWIARYTLSPPGMVVRMFLRVPAAFDPEAPMEGYRFVSADGLRMTSAREKVLEFVNDGMAWSRSGLAHAAGVSSAVVSGMIKAGALKRVDIPPQPAVADPDPDLRTPEFSEAQSDAAKVLTDAVSAGKYSATLLKGVTGSGKTEVYFEAIAEALRQEKQVLILLPEIALTATFLERFEKRFGAPPAEWHSGMAPKRREKIWRQVATGQVRVVAGARSALFLPFANPGLIIVDEEHESAYKQEDRVYYHARDMAVVRANIGDFPIVLASATPSIESQVNAAFGRYALVELKQRFGEAAMPDIRVIDMRKDIPARGHFLSPPLLKEMETAIDGGGQALLFLNRRGYAPLTLCRACGHRFECRNCSAWLVEHRFRGQFQCHHCGHAEPKSDACPSCGTLDHLVPCGPGVERLAEEVSETFPDARILVLSSDMMGGVTRLRLELEAIAKGEADIIIGTQLVAKGHHFPLIKCVGIVDADLGLANGDPRAAERSFQLLSQVTGRAGREGGSSVGLLQSYQPAHPVIEALAKQQDEAFYETEITSRERAGLPPFGRLASLILSGPERGETEKFARDVRFAAPGTEDVIVLGPAEAPMALVRGRYRYRILVRAARAFDMQSYLRQWLASAPRERGQLRLQIDVDPQTFL